MKLWHTWLMIVNELRPAFSRQITFLWFCVCVAGFMLKFDHDGVTSLVRGMGLRPNAYSSLLRFFNSTAVKLPLLQRLWVKQAFKLFEPKTVKINDRYVVLGDGIKIPKEGECMPARKALHQESSSNSKAERIMGHSLQAIALLAEGVGRTFAVPLAAEIHEGVRTTATQNLTVLDKLFIMIKNCELPGDCYFVLDRYYGSGRLFKAFIQAGHHAVTRMKKDARACFPMSDAEKQRRGRGRPKKYGRNVKLTDLFDEIKEWKQAESPTEPGITIEYYDFVLLWKPLGKQVRFVYVKHPTKGQGIYMCTDLEADPVDVLKMYQLRFKIEVTFKQAIHQIGAFTYRFWLKCMQKVKPGSGDHYIQFTPREFQIKFKRKLAAYHLYILCAFIAHGITHYLATFHPKTVWSTFRSWMRTMSPDLSPSEKVTSLAVAQSYSEFLIDEGESCIFKKFLLKQVDWKQVRVWGMQDREAA